MKRVFVGCGRTGQIPRFLANPLGQASDQAKETLPQQPGARPRTLREAFRPLSAASAPLPRSAAEEREGAGGAAERREGRQEGGGGKPSAEPAGVTVGQYPPVPSSSFKIPVVSFVQHEKEPQQSAA